MGWLTDTKIPVGKTAKNGFEWLRDNAEWFFEGFEDGLSWLIELVLTILNYPNPLIIVALFVALTWAIQRKWKICLLVLVGFLFILNQGYWEETMESLTLVAFACATCMAIGVPIGIAAAHRPRLYAGISPVLDLMQTLPTFVYLIPMIVFFGIGMVPGLVATVIFVVPAPIRLTYLGIHATPKPLLEAAEAFGATGAPNPVEGRAALCLAPDHGRAEPDDHAKPVDGGDRRPGRGRRAWACRWCAHLVRSTRPWVSKAGW